MKALLRWMYSTSHWFFFVTVITSTTISLAYTKSFNLFAYLLDCFKAQKFQLNPLLNTSLSRQDFLLLNFRVNWLFWFKVISHIWRTLPLPIWKSELKSTDDRNQSKCDWRRLNHECQPRLIIHLIFYKLTQNLNFLIQN